VIEARRIPVPLRRLPEWWRARNVMVRDLPWVLPLLVLSLLPSMASHGTEVGNVPQHPMDALGTAIALLQTVPLILRRRLPAVSLVLVSVGFALDQLLGYHLVSAAALPIALLSAGAHLERHRRTVIAMLAVAYVPFAVGVSRLSTHNPPDEFITFFLVLILPWAAGSWLRTTRLAEAERRRAVAEATRTAERTRIARELHDVVTHHVTAMVVQTEAARYLTAAPERLDQTLAGISATGRRAITDLRHLLDLLNPDHSTSEREPSTPRIATVVEQTRDAGQPIEFAEEGTPPDSAGSADLVAYRVVQEALTNALKYDHGSRTAVRVRHGEREISVEVTTDGTGSAAASPGGSGRGLEGLRERVRVLGGDFAAGERDGGGFEVRASIPAGGAA
jgi:signal transduction histidine kinase